MAETYQAIVIGTSAGGLFVLSTLLEALPADYAVPVAVVQHRAKDQRDLLEEILQNKCRIRIKQADEKEKIQPGVVYIAPPDYHLLVEKNRTFSLSADEPVRNSRPSIDVLFETAAMVFKGALAGILLTGASNDGTAGLLPQLADPPDRRVLQQVGVQVGSGEGRCVEEVGRAADLGGDHAGDLVGGVPRLGFVLAPDRGCDEHPR